MSEDCHMWFPAEMGKGSQKASSATAFTIKGTEQKGGRDEMEVAKGITERGERQLLASLQVPTASELQH